MVDIVIVGGGVIGATCALILARNNFKVTLIEFLSKSDLLSPNLDRRNIAISYGSVLLLKELNIWEKLNNYSSPISDILVSQKGSFAKTFLNSKEYNIPAFGYTVSLQMIKKVLWDEIVNTSNIKIKFQTKLIDVCENKVIIENQVDNTKSKLNYDLCVASDGNNSVLKTLANIETESHDYNQTAVLSTIFHEKPHNGFAFERFLKDETLAILPLKDYLNSQSETKKNISSLVLVAENNQADRIFELDNKNFIKNLQEKFGFRLGKITEVANRQKFNLKAIISKKLYDSKNKIVFLGNSANSLHPVMAQGLNLGLRDAYTLVNKINKHYLVHGNLDGMDYLSEYELERKNDHEQIISITHFLANNKIPFFPKNVGLLFFNELKIIQSGVVNNGLGFKLYANAN